ncbi:MAG: glycosyltransferase [Devosiaceae bacterium]
MDRPNDPFLASSVGLNTGDSESPLGWGDEPEPPMDKSSSKQTSPRKAKPSWQMDLPVSKDGLRGLAHSARYVPLRTPDGQRGAVYEDTPHARTLIARLNTHHPMSKDRLFLAPRNQIQAMWAQGLKERLTSFALTHLINRQPGMSAKQTLVRSQAIALVLFGLVFVAWGVVQTHSLLLLFNAAFAFFYLSVGLIRVMAVLTPLPNAARYRTLKHRTSDDALPPYSVLVPIYDEAAMVPHLIAAMTALDYPADKLDILILAEADDASTLETLNAQPLPDHIAVIAVPPSQPRTKPKALNFALPLTRGTYVTIYDAEDRPEPDQLRKAVAAFDASKKDTAPIGCVQAALNITNGSANFITRHFELEYMALFDAFLPALSRMKLPIPLGGTSNHFPRAALLHAGGWDPYNVTEDADLGVRLARLGYTTKTIASTTFEEAPVRFKPWLKQRARWFKGWWQTWLVHMRHPLRLFGELGFKGFTAFQTIMLGVLISVLIHPFFLVSTLAVLGGFAGSLYQQGSGQALLAVNMANFALGYLAAAALGVVGAERRGVHGILPALLTIPIYWVCLSLAGFLALWELIRRPHHWNKTPHGES